jgi:hypothetical protein
MFPWSSAFDPSERYSWVTRISPSWQQDKLYICEGERRMPRTLETHISQTCCFSVLVARGLHASISPTWTSTTTARALIRSVIRGWATTCSSALLVGLQAEARSAKLTTSWRGRLDPRTTGYYSISEEIHQVFCPEYRSCSSNHQLNKKNRAMTPTNHRMRMQQVVPQ